MKILYLIRHAKSGWDDTTQTDFERTLNDRGMSDAKKMAKILKEKKIIPNLFISSPATRAFDTANFFASEFLFPEIKTDSRIYEATTRDLADVVNEIDDSNNVLFLFGHNPGITSFANLLSKEHIGGMPTCSVVGLELNISSWKNLERHCGKLLLFDYPKNH